MKQEPVESAAAGDIIAVAGFKTVSVADTLCALEVTKPIAAQPVDPPTLAVTFAINDSPLAGQSGAKGTSSIIGLCVFTEGRTGEISLLARNPLGGLREFTL